MLRTNDFDVKKYIYLYHLSDILRVKQKVEFFTEPDLIFYKNYSC